MTMKDVSDILRTKDTEAVRSHYFKTKCNYDEVYKCKNSPAIAKIKRRFYEFLSFEYINSDIDKQGTIKLTDDVTEELVKIDKSLLDIVTDFANENKVKSTKSSSLQSSSLSRNKRSKKETAVSNPNVKYVHHITEKMKENIFAKNLFLAYMDKQNKLDDQPLSPNSITNGSIVSSMFHSY